MVAERVIELDADAAPDEGVIGLASSDWPTLERTVRRMQQRIVSAVHEGNWRKVRRLQWLLTHSFAAKAVAVRRVVMNRGKKTPGVDGILWETSQEKIAAVRALTSHGYRPKPLRRVHIPKPNGKKRPLGIPTMYDRAMQALYLLALDPVVETQSDPNSYGFRRYRCAADAIVQLHNCLGRRASAEWVLEADIQGCFDNISHEWMLAHVPMDKTILKKWLKSGWIEQGLFHKTEAGTPQGGIISPTLANCVLNGLEKSLEAYLRSRLEDTWKRDGFESRQAAYQALKVNVVRYADDFVITGQSKELLEREVMPWVKSFLAERGLNLQMAKTRIVHVTEGFDFLGFNVRKYVQKSKHKKAPVHTKPSKTAVKRFYVKVREIVRKHRSSPQHVLVKELNSVIRGWANYFSAGVSKKLFGKLDWLIGYKLWQWAKRRHPNRGSEDIRARYWHSRGNRKAVFGCLFIDQFGKPGRAWLYSMSGTPVGPHIKIPGDVNPYEPRGISKYEDTLLRRLMKTTRGSRKLKNLLKRQRGLCGLCGKPFEMTEDAEKHSKTVVTWDKHHIVRRVDGGGNGVRNLMLVHPPCHIQHHSLASKRATEEGQKETRPEVV